AFPPSAPLVPYTTLFRSPVRAGRRGIVVRLEKNPIHACGHGCARKRLNELRLSSARAALTSGKLHGMRHVKNHGIAGPLHHRERDRKSTRLNSSHGSISY